MRKLLALFALFPTLAFAEPLDCRKPEPGEPILYMSDFKWGQSLPEMGEKFKTIYASGKRLKGRAYFDEILRSYVFEMESGKVRIGSDFIRNITRHAEISLERRYADFIFFPDMGHSHLYIPLKDWPALEEIPMKDRHLLYEKMLSLPSLQVLYHTAEQLSVREGGKNDGLFPQDKILLWRYFSRNPVGDNLTGENVAPRFAFDNENYNTVGELPGHRGWSAGFIISASKDGCFSYRAPDGTTYRFDLSLEDLPYSPVGDGDIQKRIRRDFGHQPRR
jgi:hypothetical protein